MSFIALLERLTGTVKVRIHCPALECRHVANARSIAAATASIEDHIARVHGSLVKTA